jgi:hypothetical protein
LLSKTDVIFSAFEAFDKPEKAVDACEADPDSDTCVVETSWGLFKNDRMPKQVADLFK